MEKTKIWKGHLSLEERQIIYRMLGEGHSYAVIGKVIGRDRSVVYRESKRNSKTIYVWTGMNSYEKANYANQSAKRHRSASKRGKQGPLKLVLIRERVAKLLEDGHYSPETIADIISQSDLGVKLCGRTIRRWLLKEAPELRQHLPERGKRRRHHLTPSRRRKKVEAAPEKRNIHERPKIIEERDRVGDLEGDTVVCRKSKVSIVSVIDRKTRRRWYRRVENLESSTVLKALIEIFYELPPMLRHTITFDHGSEFAKWKELEHLFGIVVYFCDPYCAHQKGSVEHSNKELRRFIPKGTDLSLVTAEQLQRIEEVLNNKPMLCLAKFSAQQALSREFGHVSSLLH